MNETFSWNRATGSGDMPWVNRNHEQFGFGIESTGPRDKRIVVSTTETTEADTWEAYFPMQSTISLHRNFAAIPTRPPKKFIHEILNFVYWFGFLKIGSPRPGKSEDLDFWRSELRDMQSAIIAYDLNEESFDVAREKVDEHCAVTLTEEEGLIITPRNLIGVMWLEYASSVHRKKTKAPVFCECLCCPRFFEQSRKDQKFCCHNCKMYMWRLRQHPGWQGKKKIPVLKQPRPHIGAGFNK